MDQERVGLHSHTIIGSYSPILAQIQDGHGGSFPTLQMAMSSFAAKTARTEYCETEGRLRRRRQPGDGDEGELSAENSDMKERNTVSSSCLDNHALLPCYQWAGRSTRRRGHRVNFQAWHMLDCAVICALRHCIHVKWWTKTART